MTYKYLHIYGLTLTLLLSVCGRATPSDADVIKINTAAITSYAPLFIAETEGYFQEEGIELEHLTFNRSSEGLALIVTGDLDALATSVTAGLLNVVGQEENVKVVADRGHIAPEECTYHGLLLRKDLYESGEVASPADLAGRPIAASTAGTSAFMLSTLLAEGGLTLDDLEISDVPSTAYLDAFENGTLDGIVAAELSISRVLNGGNAVLWVDTADVVGNIQLSVLVFGKRLRFDEPELGLRFMTAYLKGVQQYNEGKTERNLQIISEATGESIETLEGSCWLPISADGSIDFSGIDAFQVWAVAHGELDQVVTEEQFWDPSIVAQAWENPNQ